MGLLLEGWDWGPQVGLGREFRLSDLEKSGCLVRLAWPVVPFLGVGHASVARMPRIPHPRTHQGKDLEFAPALFLLQSLLNAVSLVQRCLHQGRRQWNWDLCLGSVPGRSLPSFADGMTCRKAPVALYGGPGAGRVEEETAVSLHRVADLDRRLQRARV